MLKGYNEKKIVITIGTFDKFSRIDDNLTFQMRKVAVPNGFTVAFLLSDYLSYEENGFFPHQQLEHRKKNMKLFVDDVEAILSDPNSELEEYILKAREDYPDYKIICVMYVNAKGFLGRAVLKKLGVPIKFIKYPKNAK